MTNTILELNKVSKNYEHEQVLKDVSMQVNKGEFVAIMGKSGCGKSTLLYCMSGMDKVSDGNVLFEGQEINQLPDKQMEQIRLTKMGFIFQKANFLGNLSIEDNIVFPAFQAKKESRTVILNNAKDMMKSMGIFETAEKDTRKVSGGQLQRAAICRALINHPDIIFCDEPTGALNVAATKEVMKQIEMINEQGTTILIVTHDANVAAKADRIIYLEDGCILDEYVNQEKDLDSFMSWIGDLEKSVE